MSRKSKATKPITPTKATLEPLDGEPEVAPTPIEPPTQPIEPASGGRFGLGRTLFLAVVAIVIALVWKKQQK